MLEHLAVEQLVDPGLRVVHGQQQKYKGNQVNIVIALGHIEGEEGKNGCQIQQQLLRRDILVVGSRGEVIDQNTDAQGREGPQQGDVEKHHGAPDVIAGIQKCLDHQNGGGEDEFPGQLFIFAQQSVDKVAADDQGAQLPEGVIGAAAEEARILQKEEFGDGGIDVLHDRHDLARAGLAQERNDACNEGVHRQDNQGKDVMGVQGFDVVFGVADLIVCVVRVGLIFVIKLLSQEEAGNDEKQLHGDAGARRDLRAEMEHRNEISKNQLENIERIDAFHGSP